MNIIRKAERITTEIFRYHFDYTDEAGCGFGFVCDANGVIDESRLQPAALHNLAACRRGVVNGYPVVDRGVQRFVNRYTEPAVGICDVCGREVTLSAFTNTCRCGADYNASGQRLAPRSQWGEETGEHWSECY